MIKFINVIINKIPPTSVSGVAGINFGYIQNERSVPSLSSSFSLNH
jgi:hypothetical protein